MKNMKWIERIVYVSQLLMILALSIRLAYMYITYGTLERTVLGVMALNVGVLLMYNPLVAKLMKERKPKDEIQDEKE